MKILNKFHCNFFIFMNVSYYHLTVCALNTIWALSLSKFFFWISSKTTMLNYCCHKKLTRWQKYILKTWWLWSNVVHYIGTVLLHMDVALVNLPSWPGFVKFSCKSISGRRKLWISYFCLKWMQLIVWLNQWSLLDSFLCSSEA